MEEERLPEKKFKFEVKYKKKREACGYETFRCPFCRKVIEKEIALLTHLGTVHTDITVTYYHTARRTVLPHKRHFNIEFPRWSSTTVTDYLMNDWLRSASERSNAREQIVISLVMVECGTTGMRYYYCSLCGEETEPSRMLQREHFLSQHVEFKCETSRSRYFYC